MAAVVLLTAGLSVRVAANRARCLLEHDEAITLLAAAGKALRIDAIHDDSLRLQYYSARDLQDLLQPSADTTAGDVVRSLAHQDRHPPLYFLILRGLQQLGIGACFSGRLLGTVFFLIAAWCANRWIWPDSSPLAKLLGTAWLLLTPEMLSIATELRQYSLVYLGTVLSIAALIQMDRPGVMRRQVLFLLSLAPVILLWSQYGMAIWTGLLWIAAMILSLRRRNGLGISLLGATIIAAVCLMPLAAWFLYSKVGMVRAPTIPISQLYEQALWPMAQSLVNAWVPIPWSWQTSGLLMTLTILFCGGIAFVSFPKGAMVDGLLGAAVVAWAVVWLALLAGGWIPPHATMTKQIGPLILVPLCLLVRSASSLRPRWAQSAAVGVLALSLVGQIPALNQRISAHADMPLVSYLASAKTLLADSPRRGYLLPLVEKLNPEAHIILVSRAAVPPWKAIQPFLLQGDLLLAEIRVASDQPRPAALQELMAQLSSHYGESREIWSGPRRTITGFFRKGSEIRTPCATP